MAVKTAIARNQRLKNRQKNSFAFGLKSKGKKVMKYDGNRAMRYSKERCVLCGELLFDFATIPFNRAGNFSHFYHAICVERVSKWFAENGYLVDWETMKILDRFNSQAINGRGIFKKSVLELSEIDTTNG